MFWLVGHEITVRTFSSGGLILINLVGSGGFENAIKEKAIYLCIRRETKLDSLQSYDVTLQVDNKKL